MLPRSRTERRQAVIAGGEGHVAAGLSDPSFPH
jgi:hypothetical protein